MVRVCLLLAVPHILFAASPALAAGSPPPEPRVTIVERPVPSVPDTVVLPLLLLLLLGAAVAR